MSEAPQPKTDIAAAQRAAAAELEVRLFGAPPSLGNAWAARRDLVEAISADWASDERRVVGLVGFGGGGKSSLARRLVELLLTGRLMPAPQGVFWWSFYDSADLDQFFEELLRYLSGEKLDPRQINSAYMRAQVAGAMLGQRVLFVLDGFEVMQHEGAYQYGLVKNRDLLSFLEYMADPTRHQSFCVITSRVPVYQLASYSTYTQYTVGGLDVDAGRHLLRTRGVRGSDEELARLVQDWEGHPLTLELIADYLARNFAGNVTCAGNIPPPSAQESPYERVQRVLSWYDVRLSDTERSFLTCFSAFRVPVREKAIERAFRSSAAETLALASSVAALDRESFDTLFERLLDAQIVPPSRRRHDGSNRHCPTRPNRERKRQILLGSARLGRPARLSSRLARPVTENPHTGPSS